MSAIRISLSLAAAMLFACSESHPPAAAHPDATPAHADGGTGSVNPDGRCSADHHVLDGACQPCPVGSSNTPGDDPTGENTVCEDLCQTTVGIPCESLTPAYVKALNPGRGDRFGTAVALDDDTLVIGAPGEGSAARGTFPRQDFPDDNAAERSGAVYVFRRVRSIWSLEAVLKASNAQAEDGFGGQLLLRGDRLWVSAVGEDSLDSDDPENEDGEQVGAIYAFEREGSTWRHSGYLKPALPNDNMYFGMFMALCGNTLAVSAVQRRGEEPPLDAVYLFENAAPWRSEGILVAPNRENSDFFGRAIACSESVLAVGASQESSGDANNPDDNSVGSSGAVYTFRRSDDTWAFDAYLKAPRIEEGARFGEALAVHDDLLFAAASSENGASPADPNPISLPNSGSVHVFRDIDGTWTYLATLKAPTPDRLERFGFSLSISNHGLIIGAPGNQSRGAGIGPDEDDDSEHKVGAAYIARFSDGPWRVLPLVLKPTNPDPNDQFGNVVVAEGNAVAITAINESSDARLVDGDRHNNNAERSGAVYVFELPSP